MHFEVGDKINHWTVISPYEKVTYSGENKIIRCLCKCKCGTVRWIAKKRLSDNSANACGCVHLEKITTHGGYHSRIYNIWSRMRKCCYSKTYKDYKHYGGRGIIIMFTCFEDFRHWALSSGYYTDLSVDRIDNDGPYSRDNCRWVPLSEQPKNRRTCVFLTNELTGETKTQSEWSRSLGLSRHGVRMRIHKGKWSIQKAITTRKHIT